MKGHINYFRLLWLVKCWLSDCTREEVEHLSTCEWCQLQVYAIEHPKNDPNP